MPRRDPQNPQRIILEDGSKVEVQVSSHDGVLDIALVEIEETEPDEQPGGDDVN